MRTTLTLDDDVAAALLQLRKSRNSTFKTVVNETLRDGLYELTQPRKENKPFRTRVFDMGPSLVGNLDNIGEVLAIAEGEDYK
ncbi:MAG: DUF2191 domain-containing protein [Candidatus Hydrogenedentes bacterium]|nr:DUF2191 domain-containing protein [Candidatus Hydrogenedentota bacterium]